MKQLLEIKRFKSFRGLEGYGFNLTLYINGKKAALVDDAAQGAEYQYHWFDDELHKLFNTHVASLPPEKSEYFPEGLSVTDDMAIAYVITEYENAKEQKRLAKLCFNNTLFVTGEGKKGEYKIVKTPLTDVIRAKWIKKYPNAKFINDHLTDGEWKALLGLKNE